MFYLAAAFIVVWLAVTLYVVFMSNRQSHLEDELHTLEELVQEQRTRG
jgi:CcmD family protein